MKVSLFHKTAQRWDSEVWNCPRKGAEVLQMSASCSATTCHGSGMSVSTSLGLQQRIDKRAWPRSKSRCLFQVDGALASHHLAIIRRNMLLLESVPNVIMSFFDGASGSTAFNSRKRRHDVGSPRHD